MPEKVACLPTALDYVTISVSDVARSADFYNTTFGFQILHQSKHFALLSMPNVNLGLHAGRTDGAVNVNLHLRVTDLDRAYEELMRSGLVFNEEPKLQPWGIRSASLSDPDGYRLELIEESSPTY